MTLLVWAKPKYPIQPLRYVFNLATMSRNDRPCVGFVSSRIRSSNRSSASGAIRRFGSGPLVQLNPRNFRSQQGRVTLIGQAGE